MKPVPVLGVQGLSTKPGKMPPLLGSSLFYMSTATTLGHNPWLGRTVGQAAGLLLSFLFLH